MTYQTVVLTSKHPGTLAGRACLSLSRQFRGVHRIDLLLQSFVAFVVTEDEVEERRKCCSCRIRPCNDGQYGVSGDIGHRRLGLLKSGLICLSLTLSTGCTQRYDVVLTRWYQRSFLTAPALTRPMAALNANFRSRWRLLESTGSLRAMP